MRACLHPSLTESALLHFLATVSKLEPSVMNPQIGTLGAAESCVAVKLGTPRGAFDFTDAAGGGRDCIRRSIFPIDARASSMLRYSWIQTSSSFKLR
jgi:hypothetical protein